MEFVCMSRDYRDGSVEFTEFGAVDEEAAWGYVEEEVASNISQDWLFSKDEWEKFLEQVKTFGKIQVK